MSELETSAAVVASALPDGDYAVVEMLGHRTLLGRISEVERFGGKLMQIEPIYRGALLPPVLVSSGSLYQFTPVSRETAAEKGPTSLWGLPGVLRTTIPAALLPAPDEKDAFDE